MRDTIDPNAPFDARLNDVLGRLRQMEGDFQADIASATDAKLIDRVLDQARIAIEQASEQHLRQIDAALARMVDGEYGYCANCGAAIGVERLERLPATILCERCCR
ncbi:MAG: TraR/DksA family transcriptional regulator [Rhodobacteraceae bacterium]|nr:MAG: TraR/DksA family transcriptional regulator [Paracoccaceae bacterium]